MTRGSGPPEPAALLDLLEPGWRRELSAGALASAIEIEADLLGAAARALGDPGANTLARRDNAEMAGLTGSLRTTPNAFTRRSEEPNFREQAGTVLDELTAPAADQGMLQRLP
jgi:hypothetical protein